MSKEPKVLKFVQAKGRNKRIEIQLLEGPEGGKFFLFFTRTLVDFSTRNILETKNIYSVETFAVMAALMSDFLDNSEVKNKIIHREMNKIIPFTAHSNLVK